MLWTESKWLWNCQQECLESPSNLPAPQESYICLKQPHKAGMCDKHNSMCKVILQQLVQAEIDDSSWCSGQWM